MIRDLLPFLVTGIATGAIYAIAATGLVLTFKTSGIFNLAHGAQAAAGAYVMWDLWKGHGWPWPLALMAALFVVGVVGGLLLERVASALADKATASRVAATVGLLLAVQGLVVVRYGSATIPMSFFLPTSTFRLAGVNVRYEQLIVVVISVASAVSLTILFRRTRIGVAMQGVVDDPSLVALQGISPVAVRRSAWMIGSCFAALSGALLAPSLGLDATLLTLLVVQAFGAAAIGRFSSLPLTFVGGVALGVGQELVKYVIGRPIVADHVSGRILQPLPSNLPFLVLFVVLLVIPKHKLVERGAAVVRRELSPRPWSRAQRVVLLAGGAVSLLAIPRLVDTALPRYEAGLAYVVLFASLYLLVRVSGQVSLCHMAFAAIGSAAFVHLGAAGLPFPLAVVASGLVAIPVGAFVAIPAIRLSGIYLALATFGFGILVQNVAFQTSPMFGPTQSLIAHRPGFARSDEGYYYALLIVAAAACGLVVAVRRSRLGRMLRALADAPDAVVAHGGSTSVIRTLAFCISAFLAGVGGAVLGPVTGSATGPSFNFGISLALLAVLLICGRRPVLSALLAAALYVVSPGYISDADLLRWTPVVFGVAAIVVTCGVPGRLVELLRSSPRLAARTEALTRTEVRVSGVAS